MAHKEVGETAAEEAKAHSKGFLKSAERKAGKMKEHKGKGKPPKSKAHKGGY